MNELKPHLNETDLDYRTTKKCMKEIKVTTYTFSVALSLQVKYVLLGAILCWVMLDDSP